MLFKYGKCMFLEKIWEDLSIIWRFFNRLIIQLVLVGYEMIKINSMATYHPISVVCGIIVKYVLRFTRK